MSDEKPTKNRLGKYEVLKMLEDTASGQLYSARDAETGRLVVLKVVAYDTGATPVGTDAATTTPTRRPEGRGSAAAGPAAVQPVHDASKPVGSGSILSAARVVVLLLVITAAGALGYYVGYGWPTGRTKAVKAGGTSRTGAVPAQGTGQATPSIETATGAPAQPPKSREQLAKEAYDKAAVDWERYSRKEDYELGLAAFDKVTKDYADTSFAAKSHDEMARIYTEWARAEAKAGKHAEAVANYAKATEMAPKGNAAGDIARASMPLEMVALADLLAAEGEYDRALSTYEDLARQYRGTKEAALIEKRKPEILVQKGFSAWKNDKDCDKAIAALSQVVRDYGGTASGRRANETLPDVYADAIRQKLDKGQPEEAQRQLGALVAAYPEREAAAKTADLDAEIMFRLFEKAQAAGRTDEAAQYSDQLTRRHPASPWIIKSGRMKLNLEGNGVASLAAGSAQNEMRKAQAQYDRLDFAQAVATLKGVIRSAKEDSPEAVEALDKLPGWLYESALFQYGTGSGQKWEATLRELSAQFPGSVWDRNGAEALKRVKTAPEGMMYVPEGRFWMGTDAADIIALLRSVKASGLEGDDESLKLFADLAGLLSETPRHVATTGAFYIDKTEVTNEQYKRYVEAAGAPAPRHWRNGAFSAGDGALPVTNVTVAEAEAYAKWRKCRLPTEAEWEKAARGADGRAYPWGEKFSENCAQHMKPEAAGPVSVGTFPNGASPYGCLDAIGNVREWTRSPMEPYANSEWKGSPDILGLAVAKGGAWHQEELAPIPARCASRYPLDPTKSDKATGFRCVRDVTETAAAGAPLPVPAH